jgi:hypothetical protein
MKLPVVLGTALVAGAAAMNAQDSAPVWAKSDAFWYRTTVNGSDVWVTVDAEHGVRQPLFDHQRLAIELSQKSGIPFTASTLPFADPGRRFVVKYDGSSVPEPQGLLAIEFVLDNAVWRCELQAEWDWARTPPSDYECTKQDGPVPPAPPEPAPTSVASPDGKWEAFVRNDNVMVRAPGATAATALSKDGTPARGYHAGSISWSPDSRAVSAYRVDAAIWRSHDVGGTVKALITKGTWAVPGIQAQQEF